MSTAGATETPHHLGQGRKKPIHPASVETQDPNQSGLVGYHDQHSPEQNVIADMTVLVTRCNLLDSGRLDDDYQHIQQQTSTQHHQTSSPRIQATSIGPYDYQSAMTTWNGDSSPEQAPHRKIAVRRVATQADTLHDPLWIQGPPVVDDHTPCPYDNVKKYWNQRKRLFSRFDHGIQLDEEGWFSVTPEQIANHVAHRFVLLAGSQNRPMIVLDAFCGCGGNSIAFAKQPNVVVLAVDVDRAKLRRAANNAAIYEIPTDKLLLVECNVLFILEYVFRDGCFVLDQPIETPEAAAALMAALPPPVPTEIVAGYQIGGIDLLPRQIDAVFMDPPWGGMDYEVFGKHGYDLERNMRIARPTPPQNVDVSTAGCVTDDFFDSFAPSHPRNKSERKAIFNIGVDEKNCVNGFELLAMAARATEAHWVLYDIPRNTNRISLGQAALAAGYRGNCRLEEHFINGRLKTSTAYFGCDWRHLLEESSLESEVEDSV